MESESKVGHEPNQVTQGDLVSSRKNRLDKPCFYCGDKNHCLQDCQGILALPFEEKVKFLKGKGFCYGCLKPGHMKRFCRFTC